MNIYIYMCMYVYEYYVYIYIYMLSSPMGVVGAEQSNSYNSVK